MEIIEVGPNTYLGPCTSIGNNCRIIGAKIENSIVIDGAVIDYGKRIVNSIIGNNAEGQIKCDRSQRE